MLSWGHRRQLIVLTGFFTLVFATGAGLYFAYRPTPTCSDGVNNGTELGPDCGGACSRACVSQLVVPTPTIWWARAFSSGAAGRYDLAALVENQNAKFGTSKIKYLFRIYDQSDVLLAEKDGETFFNPQEKFVIYEPNIDLGARKPAKVFLYFDNAAIWEKAKFSPHVLSFGDKIFTALPRPQLASSVKNDSLDILRGVKFVAVLSDKEGNALAASQTMIDTLAGGEKRELNYTWPGAFTSDPVILDIYPKFNSFDGKLFD